MGIGNIPFPSFTLLLTSDRVVIPGPSYVFRLARLDTPYSQAFRETAFMSITGNYVSDDLIEESYSLSFSNDSYTDIVFRHDESTCVTSEAFTDLTVSVQTTLVGSGETLPKAEFPFHSSETVPTRFKNFFKRLTSLKRNRG